MMDCAKCSRSALSVASNGLPYCERKECCDWKLERMKAHDERRNHERLLVEWMKKHHLWGFGVK